MSAEKNEWMQVLSMLRMRAPSRLPRILVKKVVAVPGHLSPGEYSTIMYASMSVYGHDPENKRGDKWKDLLLVYKSYKGQLCYL